MSTVLLTGVGGLGGWALEFLARTEGIDRIVSVKRSPWSGPSKSTMAMLGSVFQGHTKVFEHHEVDLADVDRMARLLDEVQPDAILHSATVQSPRRFMNADVEPARRALIRSATFGLWLPWHLLPAAQLTRALDKSGVDTHVVNASFPDVVNTVLWKHFGHGPVAGAGNVEVCAARILRYVMETSGAPIDDIAISLVGSHALLAYGPDAGVPHHFELRIGGHDVTDDHDLDTILMSWPERIDWGKADEFSLFAASAVKNVVALLGSGSTDTHVTGPAGLPGGYPARIENGQVSLSLPDGLDEVAAVALNDAAARWDGIEGIEADGTVVYTADAVAAMEEIGHRCEGVTIDGLDQQVECLQDLYQTLTSPR